MTTLGYPKWIGLAPVVLATAVWIPTFDWAMYCGVALLAVAGPVLRHRALNPLGTNDQKYYQWLKTTPYMPAYPLPNGNVYPNLHDLIFLVLLSLPLLPLIRISGGVFIWGIVLAVSLALLSFCYITARQLINLGPRWIGFAIVALCIVAVRVDWFLINQLTSGLSPVNSLLLQCLPPLIPFAVAVYGLHLIMLRYPWTGENLNSNGVYRGMSLRELQYSYSDVTTAGQPYTFLNPKERWPRVGWSDSLWMSLIPALIVPFTLNNEASLSLYGFAAAGAFFGRIGLYFGPLLPSPFSGGLVVSWRQGSLWNNAVSAVLLLGLIAIISILAIRYAPTSVAGPLLPILTFMTYLAAFKLPPSRAEWETSGRWILSINGPDQSKAVSQQTGPDS